jgi:hypothetical protein
MELPGMLAAELGHEGRRFCARSLSRSPATSVRLRWAQRSASIRRMPAARRVGFPRLLVAGLRRTAKDSLRYPAKASISTCQRLPTGSMQQREQPNQEIWAHVRQDCTET